MTQLWRVYNRLEADGLNYKMFPVGSEVPSGWTYIDFENDEKECEKCIRRLIEGNKERERRNAERDKKG